MNAQLLFDTQLISASLVTLDTISYAIERGFVAKSSPIHEEFLSHVGERKVYYVADVVLTESCELGDLSFGVQVLSCWESEIANVLRGFETTHTFVGASTSSSNLPRFVLKGKDNATT